MAQQAAVMQASMFVGEEMKSSRDITQDNMIASAHAPSQQHVAASAATSGGAMYTLPAATSFAVASNSGDPLPYKWTYNPLQPPTTLPHQRDAMLKVPGDAAAAATLPLGSNLAHSLPSGRAVPVCLLDGAPP